VKQQLQVQVEALLLLCHLSSQADHFQATQLIIIEHLQVMER